MSNGARLEGEATGISSQLQPFLVEGTQAGVRSVCVRLRHILAFRYFVAVYTLAETREVGEIRTAGFRISNVI